MRKGPDQPLDGFGSSSGGAAKPNQAPRSEKGAKLQSTLAAGTPRRERRSGYLDGVSVVTRVSDVATAEAGPNPIEAIAPRRASA